MNHSAKGKNMIPHIKTILYPTDLSDTARYAFGYAADLARRYDALITILYVMEDLNHIVESQIRDMLGREQWEKLRTEKQDHLKQSIRSRLEDFCIEMESRIDSCRLLVEEIRITRGQPAQAILDTAKEIKADLIVMGNRGHNLLQGSLIGGTARKIVQTGSIPVLVVRQP